MRLKLNITVTEGKSGLQECICDIDKNAYSLQLNEIIPNRFFQLALECGTDHVSGLSAPEVFVLYIYNIENTLFQLRSVKEQQMFFVKLYHYGVISLPSH